MQAGIYNKVPLMIGYNNAEGIFSTLLAIKTGEKPIHKDFESFVPWTLNLKKGSEESKKIAQRIKEHYYGDQQPSLETLEAFIKVN